MAEDSPAREAGPVAAAWLERFRVGSLPTIYYVPDFVTPAEEANLVYQVQSAPVAKWKTLKNRRLQNWGGIVHEKGLISQPVPAWLKVVTEKLTKETNLFPAPINHVLVNEYLPGQGITSHQDGPVYHPVVAILSLGSPTLMHFTPHARLLEPNNNGDAAPRQTQESSEQLQEQTQQGEEAHQKKATCSVVLMPGSLLLFKDSAYADYLHGIDEAYEDLLDDKVVNMDAYVSYVERNSRGAVEDAVVKDWRDGEERSQQRQSSIGKGTHTEDILRRTGTRVSLTCRHVSRVHKNLLRL